MHDLLTPLGLTLSPRQNHQLEAYAAMLRDWNSRINLIAASTEAELERRHILDSAQLAPHLPKKAIKVLDVGSGAGLPGLVLAILLPDIKFTLAEKVGKKAAFLQAVTDTLELHNVTVWPKQVAELKGKFDIVTCRAWAALDTILETTSPLLAKNGSWWLLKGEAVDEELKGCPKASRMTIARYRSITHEAGVILHLTPVPRGTHTE